MTVRIVTNDPDWQVTCRQCDLLLEYDAEDRMQITMGEDRHGTFVQCPGCSEYILERDSCPPHPNLGLSVVRLTDSKVELRFDLGWITVKLSDEGVSADFYDNDGQAVTEAWATTNEFTDRLGEPPEFFIPVVEK